MSATAVLLSDGAEAGLGVCVRPLIFHMIQARYRGRYFVDCMCYGKEAIATTNKQGRTCSAELTLRRAVKILVYSLEAQVALARDARWPRLGPPCETIACNTLTDSPTYCGNSSRERERDPFLRRFTDFPKIKENK